MKRLARLAICLVALSGAAHPAERHLLVVAGIGGEHFYQQLFDSWTTSMVEAARALSIPDERVVVLSATGSPSMSSKQNLLAALLELQATTRPGDLVVLVMIGHGTARNGRALFNLPGPDISANELAEALTGLAGRDLVVANTSSSSGAFVAELTAPQRVVITATASGAEYHHAHFGGHFVAAFVQQSADADKDGRISFLEAFNYAKRTVAQRFSDDQRLLTEHALLDDDGDGIGSRAPGEGSSDGALASRWFLEPAFSELAGDSETARALVALDVESRELVVTIERLKRRRDRLTQSQYYTELEVVLLELARNRREFRRVRGEHAP